MNRFVPSRRQIDQWLRDEELANKSPLVKTISQEAPARASFDVKKFKQGLLGLFGKEKTVSHIETIAALIESGYKNQEVTNQVDAAREYLENELRGKRISYKGLWGGEHHLTIMNADKDHYKITVD